MEILIYLFIIGIMLIILIYVGGIILAPILVAGGAIGVILAGIVKILCSVLKIFGLGLGKISEVETGKTKKEQLKDVEDAKWKDIIGEEKDFSNLEIKEDSKNSQKPNNIDIFDDAYEYTPKENVQEEEQVIVPNADGKLPAGFFDNV